MLIKVDVESSLMNKRNHNKAMRQLFRESMEDIRDDYWPKHFESNSETRPGGGYGYEPRGRGYQIYKAKSKGHQKPLVLSGRMKESILSGPRITATSKGGKIRSRNYFPMTLQRRQEIEAVSDEERRELAKQLEEKYVRLANRPEFQRKRKRS